MSDDDKNIKRDIAIGILAVVFAVALFATVYSQRPQRDAKMNNFRIQFE